MQLISSHTETFMRQGLWEAKVISHWVSCCHSIPMEVNFVRGSQSIKKFHLKNSRCTQKDWEIICWQVGKSEARWSGELQLDICSRLSLEEEAVIWESLRILLGVLVFWRICHGLNFESIPGLSLWFTLPLKSTVKGVIWEHKYRERLSWRETVIWFMVTYKCLQD